MNTEFLGLKLKNPIIVAAGPWNRDGRALKRSLDAGAGAVITETVVTDAYVDVRPRIAYDSGGVENVRLYSDIQVEGWEKEMEIAKENGGIVIASISGHTPSEVLYLAEKMEKFGADAIELSVSSPMGESVEVAASSPDIVFEVTSEVSKQVKIPVMVKLSQNATNIAQVAKAAKLAGAAGVSAINTVRCILNVDIENAQPMLSTYGGYSGAPIRPLGLASVAAISQSVNIPICGIGGVESARNIVEYIMLGASAVQVGTGVMLNGIGIIIDMINELDKWMKLKGYKSMEDFRGKALDNLKPLSDMTIKPVKSQACLDTECEEMCRKCVNACIYGAIEKNEDVEIDKDRCTGCGLCTYICPSDKLHLKW